MIYDIPRHPNMPDYEEVPDTITIGFGDDDTSASDNKYIAGWQNNFSDGYQFGDFLSSLFGIDRTLVESATSPEAVQSVVNSAGDVVTGSSTYSDASQSVSDDVNNANKLQEDWIQKVFDLNNQSAIDAYNRSQTSADIAYERNKSLAEAERDWNAMREDTAISRYMEQLEKAGINPRFVLSSINMPSVAGYNRATAQGVDSSAGSVSVPSTKQSQLSFLGSVLSFYASLYGSTSSAVTGIIKRFFSRN